MTQLKQDLSDDYIVFIPTSTPEKVALYQYAADAAGWPIQFRQMQDLVDAFHIIDETEGDYEKNAEDKLAAAETIIKEFNNGKSHTLIELCEKKWGIRFQKDHVLFATDDSGFDAPPGVWQHVDKTGIPLETLKKVESYLAVVDPRKDAPPKGGAGTELAPVLSAVLGALEYVNRVSAGIIKHFSSAAVADKKVEFVEHATMMLRLLSEDASREPISCHTPLVFQYSAQPTQGVKTCWHYLSPKTLDVNRLDQDEDKTAAELGMDYVGHYSPRRQIVDYLATQVMGLTQAHKNKYAHYSDEEKQQYHYKNNRKDLASFDQPFNVIGLNFDSKALDKDSPFPVYNFSIGQSAKQSIQQALSEVETLMKGSDAFVLTPDHTHLDVDRFRKYYTLFSMLVAKQLVGRDMHKAIVIQNHDGSWNDAIAMHEHLVSRGMTKDFNFSPHRQGLAEDTQTTLRTNGYFDIISGSDRQAIDARTTQLLDWHRAHYEKRDLVNGEPVSKPAEGEKPPEDMYKVAVFLSAGNENADLNKATSEFCKNLAFKGYGMITGGGDRYAMGAAYEGYYAGQGELKKQRSNKRTWSAAFSTEILLKSETKDGTFAKGFNYTKCCANIYERMAGMLETSDTVVVRAGGAGTVQEWMAFLILKQQFPEKMAGKNIIVYDPTVFATDQESFYEPVLHSVLGDKYDDIVGKNGPEKQKTASEATGIYVVRDNDVHVEPPAHAHASAAEAAHWAKGLNIDDKIMELLDGFAEEKHKKLAEIAYRSNRDNWVSAGDERENMLKAMKPGFTEDYEAERKKRSQFAGLVA